MHAKKRTNRPTQVERLRAEVEKLKADLLSAKKAAMVREIFGDDPGPPYLEGEVDRDGLPALDYEKVFARMDEISKEHYRKTTRVGVHSFIEHTGLMNEHIRILRAALSAGLQPEHLSVHGSKKFPMAPAQAAYLAEKFACIFAPYLDRAAMGAFVEALWEEIHETPPSKSPYLGIPAGAEFREYAQKVEASRQR